MLQIGRSLDSFLSSPGLLGQAPRGIMSSRPRWKGQVFGDVEAPSREAAEAEAVRTFNLTSEQRSRLVVQERG